MAADPHEARLADLEKAFGGRLGVFALNTANGAQLAYRAGERFAFCSTFKVLLASAILQRSQHHPGLLQQRIHYTQGDLVNYSPISEKQVASGMSVAELCAAALQYSDNSAANLLIRQLGGLAAVTAFARSTGNADFRLDRWETELNSAIPGDPRDTATPESMVRSLQHLALGDGLQAPQRKQLVDWLKGNTTGGARIRAGVPASWPVGDKTGSGDYGTGNDLGIIWPAGRGPIVLGVYTTQREKDAAWRNDVIAEAAKIVTEWVA
jgi:beta-lactamase class A